MLSLFFLPLLTLFTPSAMADTPPVLRNYGVVLFRALDMIDVFGPLEILQGVARSHHINLFLLADTLDPVLTSPSMPSMNPTNSTVYPILTPTHTFADAPDLDVLLVPGGAGMRAPNETIRPVLDYISETYPKVKYLITVCTGSALVARTGILDGRRATTNKSSWAGVIGFGPLVKWVAPARWVVDGNIWTSSGVTAGMDLMFAFVKAMYPDGQAIVDTVTNMIEYVPHGDPHWDPFSAANNVTSDNHL